MAVGRTNAAAKGGGGIDYSTKPQITFDGKWSNWHIEFYDGVPYWEALFSSSGTLTNSGPSVQADAWGIGGGGGGDWRYAGGTLGHGGGSGYLAMALAILIAAQSTMAITIGAGGNTGENGGSTNFGSLSALGGYHGYIWNNQSSQGKGGSNGGKTDNSTQAGENGTPGDGKIMSKFFSVEHNNEYGARGALKPGGDGVAYGGGGGGYLDVGAPGSGSGHGFGGGGGGGTNSTNYDVIGRSGCLIIRIKAA